MKRAKSARRAFALTTAIILLGLVGVAVAGLTTALAADVRRTGRARGDAQLRQLLIAGAHAARERLDVDAPPSSVELPPELAGEGAALTLATEAGEPGTVRVSVQARLGPRSASQTIVFATQSGQWRAVSATLSP